MHKSKWTQLLPSFMWSLYMGVLPEEVNPVWRKSIEWRMDSYIAILVLWLQVLEI